MGNNVNPGAAKAPGAGDMFFKVKGAKHGDIQGEAQDRDGDDAGEDQGGVQAVTGLHDEVAETA